MNRPEFQAVVNSIASGNPQRLRDGTLFRLIRGLESKLFLVTSREALSALSRRALNFIARDETSNAALRAVAQAAANTNGLSASKESEDICWQIAQVPGLLSAVVSKMSQDVDAVRLVNNLAANSSKAANLFANMPGSVDALKTASERFRLHSFGVITHLSRFQAIAVVLAQAHFIEEILQPAIRAADEQETGLSLEDEATIARATLAIGNLSFHTSGQSPELSRYALATISRVFDFSVRGETRGTITWLPTTVLNGAANLALNKSNASVLLEVGFATPLAHLILNWEPASGLDTLELSIRASERLLECDERFEEIWQSNILGALYAVRAQDVGSVTETADRLIRQLEARMDAVCMGQHPRLGQCSPLLLLDHAVLTMIVGQAFPPLFESSRSSLDL